MRKGTSERCVRGLLVALTVLLASACTSPISIGPATTAIPETTTAVAEAVTAIAEETTPTDVPATATAVVEPTAVPVTIQCTVLNVRGLRLRAGPGTEYGVVGTLTANEALTASGKSTEADWIAVSTGAGAQGWVASNYINCGDGIPQLPVATPSSAP